jgi:hypothetical protein
MMAQFEVVSPDSSSPEDNGGHVHGNGDDHHNSAFSTEEHAGGAHSHAAKDSSASTSGRHSAHAVHSGSENSGLFRGTLGGEHGAHMVIALAFVVLGGAVGALALKRNRPFFSKLAAVALALQLGGLGWDMGIHAAAGAPLDLFENAGHLVAMGGFMLLGVVVVLPSLPTKFLPRVRRGPTGPHAVQPPSPTKP